MTPAERPTGEQIEDAILAFDAGNHAWGRYRHFVLSALPVPPPFSAEPVRAALQEAAISVLEAQAGDSEPFLAGLHAAYEGMVHYRRALPAGIQLTEIDEAIGDLEEAIALLEDGTLPEG
jgi:hypothetical protein